MKRSGQADLPLHNGRVPEWLYERMARMARAITESVIMDYGKDEFIRRISDPFWFQALGSLLGMDWHSSGITTSVTAALKRAINPVSDELGLYVCGGRGTCSRKTPGELTGYAGRTGLNADRLVRSSRLTAKIDNTAIQDGFQIYLHSFIVSDSGKWSVIQQGMNGPAGRARRYHWHSADIKSFSEEPHTSIVGENQGKILNLTDRDAGPAKQGILDIANEKPDRMIRDIRSIVLPARHDITCRDVDLKRLGAVLAFAYERKFDNFEDFLLIEGMGPKTLRSLALVSEVIHGTPGRFNDPARFSFATGGKDGIPFPVQTRVYDETILCLRRAVDNAKLGIYDRQRAIRGLLPWMESMEENFIPDPGRFKKYLTKEIRESPDYGGRTAGGPVKSPARTRKQKKTGPADCQLTLFPLEHSA